MLRLAYSFLSSAGLGVSLQPFLDELARSIKETVSVSVLDQNETPSLGVRHSWAALVLRGYYGMRLPAFTSASGLNPPAH